MTQQQFNSHIVFEKPLVECDNDAPRPGHMTVFEQLLPSLYGYSDKKQQQLQKVDHYMLLETQELYKRLRCFCEALGIDVNADFIIARDGDKLKIIGDMPRADELCYLVNRDLWFVDSFIWLQPNYTLLAHSFEMLEFSKYYEKAPVCARQKYAHFDQADKGAMFALRFSQGHVNAQVETPVNLYCV